MERWLQPALDYISTWIEFQMRASQQPGCVFAVAHRDQVVLERAIGYADIVSKEKLTVRHRFRVASHSKSFVAAGLMKLREQRKLRLDDPVGQYVAKVHPQIAETTISELLSHSAGIIRDGLDAGQFQGARPFFSRKELITDLQKPPAIDPNTRFKYSNHGYGLLGLVIEAVAGEPYRVWMKREIVDQAGLRETSPDTPIAAGALLAKGHTPQIHLGRRLVVPGDYTTDAIAPAAGFVSTAADLVSFFAQLSPRAKRSVLTVASRREMIDGSGAIRTRPLKATTASELVAEQPQAGIGSATEGPYKATSRSPIVIPDQALTLSVLTNATDGWAGFWGDGMIHVLHAFANRGAPSRRVRDWGGRWWTTWGALDFLPMGNIVMVANPHAFNPLMEASEIEIIGRDKGRIVLAAGYQSYGEPVRRSRSKSGATTEIWLSSIRLGFQNQKSRRR